MAAVGFDESSSVTVDAGQMAHAMSFRERSGFRSDEAYVQFSYGDDKAFSSSQWGIPLSANELAELDRRVGNQKALEPAFLAADALDTGAGEYFDQLDGGTAVFLTTGDTGVLADNLAKIVPEGVPFRVEAASRSWGQLGELRTEVIADSEWQETNRIDVRTVGFDTKANSIAIGVDGATEATLKALTARYGSGITVHDEPAPEGGDACTSRSVCLPLKGGIKIFKHGYESTHYCTMTMIVRIGTTFYGLTAGHCIDLAGGPGDRWDHNTTVWGTAKAETWASGANADAGIAQIDAGDVPTIKNQLYGSGTSDIRSITNYKSTSLQKVDSYVCRAGLVSNYVCGQITQEDSHVKYVDGNLIDHQWVVDFDACPGDSGGPYFLYNDIWGLHTDSVSGCNPASGTAWYSPIVWATGTLQAAGWPVVMCLTATCGI